MLKIKHAFSQGLGDFTEAEQLLAELLFKGGPLVHVGHRESPREEISLMVSMLFTLSTAPQTKRQDDIRLACG